MKQTILITGANRGLGLALTEKFLSLGFMVFAGCRVQSESLAVLAQSSPDLKVIPLDVTDEQSVLQAADLVSRESTGLDVIINNAAVHLTSPKTLLEDTNFTEIQKMLEVNTLGPLRVIKYFLPLLERGRKKLLVNISSEAGSISDCWRTTEYGYTMSKAALNMQSKLLHNYLKPKGIKVLAVHPGWIRTDMGGPNADIDAKTSAAGITELIIKDWNLDEWMYLNYQGKALKW